MTTKEEHTIQQIDPNANHCPWCNAGGIVQWKGCHAAAKHSEEWEAFKEHYERKTGDTKWVEP